VGGEPGLKCPACAIIINKLVTHTGRSALSAAVNAVFTCSFRKSIMEKRK